MTSLNQRTIELLTKKSLSVKEASELTGRSPMSFYNAHYANKLRGVPPGDKLYLDTREVLIYSSRNSARKDSRTKSEQLLKELDKLSLAGTVAEQDEPVQVTKATFEVQVTTASGSTTVAEITEGDKLITLQGETIQVTKAILPTGDTVAVHRVQPTTEEDVTDADPIPEVTLKSDTDSMYSFSSVFDTVVITLIAIFFTTAVLMVASKAQLFGLSWHNVTDLLHFIDEKFLGLL